MPEALVELLPLALLVFALAIVASSQALVKAIFDPLIAVVGRIPFLGDAIASALSAMAQAIDNALGTAYRKIDSLIGASWHVLAEQMDWLWAEVKRHANLLLALANTVAPLSLLYEGVRTLAHDATRAIHGIEHGVRDLRRLWDGIEARVKHLEHAFTHGIGDDVLPRLKSLDHRVDHILHDALPAIRAAESEADSAISDLYSWAKGKADLIGIGTFAAAVAAAIGAEALSAIKCPSFLSSFSKRGCGLWNGLEDLLGLLFDAVLFANLCDVLPEVTGLFQEFETPLTDLISAAADAACAKPPSGWVKLDVQPTTQPPPQSLGTFA